MRDCGCGQKRRSSVTVRMKRYHIILEGVFCRHEMEALLSSFPEVRDWLVEEERVSFQASRDFDTDGFVRVLADLGIQVRQLI